MKTLWFLPALLCICVVHAQKLREQVCSANQKTVDYNYNSANVIFGGLFSIRNPGSGGYGCGAINPDQMQIYEAAKFAINYLNAGTGYLPGVRFGMRAYDTCGSPVQSLNYLQEMFPSTTSYPGYCADVSPAKVSLGVLGPTTSTESLHVADLAGKIPASVLSASATSSALSDKMKFPTFLRTIPSQATFSRAMVALLQRLGWTNTFVVYTDDEYGTNSYQELLKVVENNGICVSRAIKLSNSGDLNDHRQALEVLGSNHYAGAVFLGSGAQAEVVLQAALQITAIRNVQWILSDIDVSMTFTLPQMRGVLTLLANSRPVDDFRDYFVDLEDNAGSVTGNQWFKEWYETVNNCNLPPATTNPCPTRTTTQRRNSFVQSPFVIPTIKAIFAYAETIRRVCLSGVCQALRNMNQNALYRNIAAVDFTFPNILGLNGERINFDDHGDALNTRLEIMNYRDGGSSAFSFQRVGTFENEELTLTTNPEFYDLTRINPLATIPTYACPASGCSTCLQPSLPVSLRYQSGDLVLASLVTGHQDGSLPLSCNKGLKNKLVSLAAMEWAVNRYKQVNPGRLTGVTLGSLVADVCSNPSTAQGFLSDLLNSNRLMDSSGANIPTQNIYAFVDETSNDVARVVSPLLSQNMIPEVQVGATTPSIRRGDTYPYFARAIPNEEVYAKALSALLQDNQWMHVQVVTSMNTMYHNMAQAFRAIAARHGICVVQTVDFADGDAVNKLVGYSQAHVVVVFGDSTNVIRFLTQISTAGAVNSLLTVAGTKEWATDESYIQGASRAGAQFAITFGLPLQESTDFQQWLDGLSLADVRSNVFLSDLFEVINDCSLLANSRGLYSRVCTNADTFRPYKANAPYVIESVYHVADQLHDLLTEVCGNGYSGLCNDFRSAQDIPKQLSDRMVKTSRGQDLEFFMGEGVPNIVFYVVRGGTYEEMVQFNTGDLQLANNINRNLLNSNTNGPTSCPGLCVECQYLYKFRNSHMVLGDWNLVGAFSISLPGPQALQPYTCGEVRLADGAQYTTAMFYALDQVNSGNAPVSVKGLKIGGIALDHCGNQGLTKLLATDMYAGFLNPQGVFQESVLAWLTDTSSNTKEAAEILDPLDVAIVSPSATSTSLSRYDNFFSTLQSDAVVSTAIVKLARQLGFRYLQLVHAANDFGRDSKVILTQAAQAEGICVTRSVEFNSNTSAADLVAGLTSDESHVVVLYMEPPDAVRLFDAIAVNSVARDNLVIMQPNLAVVPPSANQMRYPPLSISLRTFEVDNYEAYLRTNPVGNVFFARYYMELFQCNLNGYSIYNVDCPETLAPITSHPNFVNSVFELTTINAVYATVDALDRTVKEYCGQNYTEPCAAFLQASDKRQRFNRNLNRVTFLDEGSNVFRFIEGEGNVAYIVSQYDSTTGTYIQRGTYAGVVLNVASSMMTTYQDTKSDCTSPCLQCTSGLAFSLTEGDIYLGGVFDVHSQGLNPFLCENIKTLHGYLLLEAFHYALEQVNAKEGQFKDILTNTRLGGIGLDACSSRVRGGYLVSNINNRQFTLSRGSVTVDPDHIDAYIGSYSSQASMYLARILTDLHIPQISYASTTTDLNDKRKYPYFYRTVPSNDKQVEAMLQYLNEKDIRYVQILYQGNNNGMNARDEFVKKAESYNVCVAQTVLYPDIGIVSREQSKITIATLLENPAANTVVTFLETDAINSVLLAIDVSEEATNTFRFLGSYSWADNLEAYTGAERHALDSVTLKVDADDVQDFERYIDSKNLANNLNNPWFEEYFQRIHNCYTTRENMDTYGTACQENLPSIINSNNYQQDQDVVFVINSVYAAAFAIDTSLKQLCGDGYTSVCQAYRNSAGRRDTLLSSLASVEFADPSGRTFRFQNNQPVFGYRFYAVIPGRLGGIIYDQLGTYDSSSGQLSLKDYTPVRQWNSGCDREDACAECPAIRYRGKRYVFAPSPVNVGENATTVVALFDIHKQGVDPYRCGELNMPGFQQFLSFFYSLEQPLRDEWRGMRVLVVDTCSNPMRVDQDLFGLLQGTGLCNTQSDDTHQISHENIGTILVSGDHNTQAAARVLEPLQVTYVSPNAVSTSLDHMTHLARTISPISGKLKFISDVLSVLNWAYVDVVYPDSSEGFYPWEALRRSLSDAGICRGSGIDIGEDDSTIEIQNSLQGLNGDRGVKAVVLIGDLEFVRRVLVAADGVGIADNYVWVLSSHMEVTEDFVRSVIPSSGSIRILSTTRISETANSFSTYVRSLRYVAGEPDLNNGNIPREWFEEFFQMSNDCRLSAAMKPINPDKAECNITTAAQRRVSMERFKPDMYVMNTIAATYAALHGPSDATGKLNTEENRKNIIMKTLGTEWNMRANNPYGFTGNTELLLKFNDRRWWDAGYMVMFWTVSSGGVENLMMWNLAAELKTDDSDVMKMRESLNMTSVCEETIASGFCGCTYDGANTAALSLNPPSEKEPRNYYRYDDDGEQSYDWSVWAIAVAVVTIAGLVVTFVLFLVLMVAYPKKGGASALGYMVIFGIFCIYGINFAFFFHASDAICGVRRFLMGVVYMITFAPLLIKAIDNWRFGHVKYSDRRYSGVSSWWSMLLSAIFIVLVQCIIPIMWLILEHPTAIELPNTSNDHWWCQPKDDYDLGLVLSFSFVVFIILITTIFSALAFDTQTNNYESRWILFSCIITAGCFLVWMIVTTNAGPSYRDPAVAMANFVNATLLLLVIPFRKAVLMCQSFGSNYSSDDDGQDPYDMYQNGYDNSGLQLNDYDNQYVDSKPSEF